ncbi:MAG: GIY-YIG nuclease family protein [Patescibacteria group bacterium]
MRVKNIFLSILKSIPSLPGVYLFKDSKDNLLYIGKAINLNKRVGSYFKNENLLGTKTLQLIKNTAKVDHILVENEVSALILEAELIKKFKPKYNIELKDDKSFKHIQLTKDRISIVRKNEIREKEVVYGPFPYGSSAETIVRTLRKIFPFRDCSLSKFSRYRKLIKPCLYGYTKICPAPCIGKEGERINIENIKKVKKILSQNRGNLIHALEKEMKENSAQLNYEKARIVRDQIYKLQNMSYKSNSNEYMENPNLLIDRAEAALLELANLIEVKCKKRIDLKRIEFYDVSNISGKWAVGSMVVAMGGLVDKDQYRRFRIKTIDFPNDASMLKEVLGRRLKHPEWQTPNLIVLDGGKSQVSVANTIKELENIPILGLAKRLETVVFYDKNSKKFMEITLSKHSKALQLLQKLRDEAHRFAITYHRKLRMGVIARN